MARHGRAGIKQMPADLDTSASFADLMLRLAERVGMADQTGSVAALPTDADLLARLKKYVNEGYDRFLRAYKNWTFLEVEYTLTLDADGDGPHNIEGDAARYKLPGYVAGSPKTPWRYSDTRVRRNNVRLVAPAILDNYRQEGTGTLGPPSLAAVRNLRTGAPVGESPLGWEAIFWPTPDADYVLATTFRVQKHVLTDPAEKHVAGAAHDSAIHAFAAWAWHQDDAEDPAIHERYRQDAMERLAESIELDTQNQPDSVGDLIDPSVIRGANGDGRRLTRVSTHNGVAIPYD